MQLQDATMRDKGTPQGEVIRLFAHWQITQAGSAGR
jgi:hypothetical protein